MKTSTIIIITYILLLFTPISAQNSENNPVNDLKCIITNDRIRLLDMIYESKSSLEINIELEKHRKRLSDFVAGQSEPVTAAAEKAYYGTNEIVYRARHGNPFVNGQEVEIGLSILLDRAAEMPDCRFSKDVADLIDKQPSD